VFASYRTYDSKVGLVQTVLVTQLSTDSHYYVGHNKSYDQILVPMDGDYVGKVVKVRITSAGKHYMMCEVLSDLKPCHRPAGVPSPLEQGQVSGLEHLPSDSTQEVHKDVKCDVKGGRDVWLLLGLLTLVVALVIRLISFLFNPSFTADTTTSVST